MIFTQALPFLWETHMDSMKKYEYDGAVMEYDRCIERRWKASTYAISEKKSKSNLIWRYKRDNNKPQSSKITLPDKIFVGGING